jgi:hypothetical protein
MLDHFRKNNLINNNQHGFIPKRSCVTLLADLIDNWSYNLAAKKGKQIDAVNLDWAKAFDSVPHKRLLSKLWCYQVRNNNLCWIQSFLSERTQTVVYRGASSSSLRVTSGVCQGSVIGPLLFSIFMLDLPKCVKSKVAQYADDTFRFIVSLMRKEDLNNIYCWCLNNEMNLNASKSNHMIITKSA